MSFSHGHCNHFRRCLQCFSPPRAGWRAACRIFRFGNFLMFHAMRATRDVSFGGQPGEVSIHAPRRARFQSARATTRPARKPTPCWSFNPRARHSSPITIAGTLFQSTRATRCAPCTTPAATFQSTRLPAALDGLMKFQSTRACSICRPRTCFNPRARLSARATSFLRLCRQHADVSIHARASPQSSQG